MVDLANLPNAEPGPRSPNSTTAQALRCTNRMIETVKAFEAEIRRRRRAERLQRISALPSAPARIVAEVMEALDPDRISHPALYAGCRRHVRQVVCSILGIDDEPEDVAEKA
jgi:hypothetical protein